MSVSIARRSTRDGTWYEIEDFPAYVAELQRRDIAPPGARYRVFIPHETAMGIARVCSDLESQIALFFRLGPASGIDYRISGT